MWIYLEENEDAWARLHVFLMNVVAEYSHNECTSMDNSIILQTMKV